MPALMSLDPTDKMVKAQLATMQADAHTGAVDLPRITAQQRYYVAARVGGMSQAEAGKQLGLLRQNAYRMEKDPRVQQHIEHYLQEYSEKVLPRVRFTLEDAHLMYMEAYHSAGTSAEMTRATDSLVKLHRLTDPDRGDTGLPTNVKQLETLDTQQLLRYAAIGMDTLRPGDVLEGEFTEEGEGAEGEG